MKDVDLTKTREFIKLARSKNYREETIEMVICLSCTVDMYDKFGDSDKAMEEIIKLCEKHDDSKEFFEAVCALLD